jgi:ferredoxin
VLWRRVNRGLAAGRVQSPSVRLIVERERERIAFEFFGPASVLSEADPGVVSEAPKNAASAPAPAHTAAQLAPAAAGSHRVLFSASGRSADWRPDSGSLLDMAESCGLAPAFSCRAGVCGSCVCDLVAGEVDYLDDPLEDPGPGRVLPCCARPRSDVTLSL